MMLVTNYGLGGPFSWQLVRENDTSAHFKSMTTAPNTTVRRTEPPVNAMTDTIRLKFHELTRMVLPRSVCQACWVGIVAVCTDTIQRDAILEVEHSCPHYVEPDVVLYHALRGLPPEDYWAVADPWSEGPVAPVAAPRKNGQHDDGPI
jgi:hypothetical protein